MPPEAIQGYGVFIKHLNQNQTSFTSAPGFSIAIMNPEPNPESFSSPGHSTYSKHLQHP